MCKLLVWVCNNNLFYCANHSSLIATFFPKKTLESPLVGVELLQTAHPNTPSSSSSLLEIMAKLSRNGLRRAHPLQFIPNCAMGALLRASSNSLLPKDVYRAGAISSSVIRTERNGHLLVVRWEIRTERHAWPAPATTTVWDDAYDNEWHFELVALGNYAFRYGSARFCYA